MQEEPRQKRKLINECNDSLGTLLSYLVGVLLHQHHAMLLTVFDAGFSVDENSNGKDCRQNQPRFAWDMSLIGMAAWVLCAKELTRLLPSGVSCSDTNVMIYC